MPIRATTSALGILPSPTAVIATSVAAASPTPAAFIPHELVLGPGHRMFGESLTSGLPSMTPPRAARALPAVRSAMADAVNALSSPRPRMSPTDLRDIASDPVTSLSFAQRLYDLQQTNQAAARRVFGALSTLVAQMPLSERQACAGFLARLVVSTSFDGAPTQARALVDAVTGSTVTDAQWQRFADASRPDPYRSDSLDITGMGGAGAPDPAGFMRMFMTPRQTSDDNADPTGLGTVPPTSPGLSMILLMISAIIHRP